MVSTVLRAGRTPLKQGSENAVKSIVMVGPWGLERSSPQAADWVRPLLKSQAHLQMYLNKRFNGVTGEALEIQQCTVELGNFKCPKKGEGIERAGVPIEPTKSGARGDFPDTIDLGGQSYRSSYQ